MYILQQRNNELTVILVIFIQNNRKIQKKIKTERIQENTRMLRSL